MDAQIPPAASRVLTPGLVNQESPSRGRRDSLPEDRAAERRSQVMERVAHIAAIRHGWTLGVVAHFPERLPPGVFDAPIPHRIPNRMQVELLAWRLVGTP